ncbi:hypothetical protein EX895_002339 [Sporisorium graminicola]|uniref:Transmembrane protein n=1 Tax=Sporisorium graminicola TaxID=280036 RepID=A0A4U7KZ41_9BASI|nr:hypothetical protein EX895_002339 [Sporisorium graminicola]TKY88708.1 hypothetical protein EX895_002339 [Sporisorium graminicola]
MSNNANTTAPTNTSSDASGLLPQGTASKNSTRNSTTTPAGASVASNSTNNTDSMVTLLTFGPLSSCVQLPNLSSSTMPEIGNFSNVAKQQAISAWLASLTTTSSCTALSWAMRPDYSKHLDAMSSFQTQLEELFPLAAAYTSSAVGMTSTVSTSGAGSNLSFFPNSSSTNAFSAAANTADTLPTTLPLWIGLALACATLVHLLAFILHLCADLDALFPSLAAKRQANQKPDEFELPQHIQHPNESKEALVQDKQAVQGVDRNTNEPPRYNEPLTSEQSEVGCGLVETHVLIRIARKCKRIVVPLLMLSAAAMVGVAVVLNAKFAVGPVGSFSGSDSAIGPAVGSSSGSSAITVGANNTSAAAPISYASTSSDAGGRSRQAASPTSSSGDATSEKPSVPIVDQSRVGEEGRTSASTSTSTPTVPAMSSMARLVRRQTLFFSTPSSSGDNPSATATTTTSATAFDLPPSLSSSSTATLSTPTPSSTATDINASLFPTIATTASSALSFPAWPTAGASAPTTSMTAAASAPSVFVLQRGSSIHRLWWIVMLDLLLWLAQRRRTRAQTALDKARALVIDQLTAKRP